MKSTALRILVVEDHLPTLQALCISLTDCGHLVIPVGSMEAALKIARFASLDALVCDITLPDGDSWQLLSRIRGRESLIAVAISGLSGSRGRERSLNVGYSRYLEKPFSPAALEAALVGGANLN